MQIAWSSFRQSITLLESLLNFKQGDLGISEGLTSTNNYLKYWYIKNPLVSPVLINCQCGPHTTFMAKLDFPLDVSISNCKQVTLLSMV